MADGSQFLDFTAEVEAATAPDLGEGEDPRHADRMARCTRR